MQTGLWQRALGLMCLLVGVARADGEEPVDYMHWFPIQIFGRSNEYLTKYRCMEHFDPLGDVNPNDTPDGGTPPAWRAIGGSSSYSKPAQGIYHDTVRQVHLNYWHCENDECAPAPSGFATSKFELEYRRDLNPRWEGETLVEHGHARGGRCRTDIKDTFTDGDLRVRMMIHTNVLESTGVYTIGFLSDDPATGEDDPDTAFELDMVWGLVHEVPGDGVGPVKHMSLGAFNAPSARLNLANVEGGSTEGYVHHWYVYEIRKRGGICKAYATKDDTDTFSPANATQVGLAGGAACELASFGSRLKINVRADDWDPAFTPNVPQDDASFVTVDWVKWYQRNPTDQF